MCCICLSCVDIDTIESPIIYVFAVTLLYEVIIRVYSSVFKMFVTDEVAIETQHCTFFKFYITTINYRYTRLRY